MAEERRLLIAGHAAHGHAGEGAPGDAGGNLAVPVGRGQDFAERFDGHTEQVAQLKRPGASLDVVAERAAGIGGVRSVGAGAACRVSGTTGQVPADPVVNRPKCERAASLDTTLFEHEGPLGSREVGVEHKPGPSAHERQVAGLGELETAGGGAPVLPHDRPMARPARRSVPGHRRLALVGDPDGGNGLRTLGQIRPERGQRRLDEGPDLHRVVLDAARAPGSTA